jgi:hypothetical protein
MKRSNSILDPPRGKRARTVVPTTSAKSDESSRRRAGRVGNGTESPSSKNEAFHVRPIVTTIVSNACERSYWLPETTLMERYEIPVPKWTASLSSEWNKARRLLEAKLASDSLSFTSEQVDHHPKPFDSVQIKRFYCLHLPPCYDGRLQPRHRKNEVANPQPFVLLQDPSLSGETNGRDNPSYYIDRRGYNAERCIQPCRIVEATVATPTDT